MCHLCHRVQHTIDGNKAISSDKVDRRAQTTNGTRRGGFKHATAKQSAWQNLTYTLRGHESHDLKLNSNTDTEAGSRTFEGKEKGGTFPFTASSNWRKTTSWQAGGDPLVVLGDETEGKGPEMSKNGPVSRGPAGGHW